MTNRAPPIYSVYTITHRDTGKVYVGMTSLQRPRDRMSGLRCQGRTIGRNPPSAIGIALLAEGYDRFDFAVVDAAATYEDAVVIVQRLVAVLRASGAGVYNRNDGGNGNRRARDHGRTPREGMKASEINALVARARRTDAALRRSGLIVDENGDLRVATPRTPPDRP